MIISKLWIILLVFGVLNKLMATNNNKSVAIVRRKIVCRNESISRQKSFKIQCRKIVHFLLAEFRTDFALFDSDADGVVTEAEGVRALRACGLCMAKNHLIQCLNELSIHSKYGVLYSLM